MSEYHERKNWLKDEELRLLEQIRKCKKEE